MADESDCLLFIVSLL